MHVCGEGHGLSWTLAAPSGVGPSGNFPLVVSWGEQLLGWVAQRRRARGRTMLLRLLKLSNIFVLHEDDSRYTEGAGVRARAASALGGVNPGLHVGLGL